MEFTTIRVSVKTKGELIVIGNKDESYDDVIQKLIKKWKEGEQ